MLEKVNLRTQYEPLIWEYLHTVVHDTVAEYQSEVDKQCAIPDVNQFSVQDVSEILCKAIADQSPNEVYIMA